MFFFIICVIFNQINALIREKFQKNNFSLVAHDCLQNFAQFLPLRTRSIFFFDHVGKSAGNIYFDFDVLLPMVMIQLFSIIIKLIFSNILKVLKIRNSVKILTFQKCWRPLEKFKCWPRVQNHCKKSNSVKKFFSWSQHKQRVCSNSTIFFSKTQVLYIVG